jgi:hypothetical protein
MNGTIVDLNKYVKNSKQTPYVSLGGQAGSVHQAPGQLAGGFFVSGVKSLSAL